MRATHRIAAIVAALGLVVAACAEDSSTSDTTPPPAGTEAPAGTGAPAGTEAPSGTDASSGTEAPSDDEVNAWALEYTGGTAGEASGEPIKIGYVNQGDLFPEATIGIEAAVEYVNAELGGAGGRPLELVSCNVVNEEDGARCGTQLLNDSSVAFVMTGTLTVGNQGLYDVLNGQKPVIIGNGLTVSDFLNTAGKAFTTGSVGVVPGLGEFALTFLDPAPQSAAIIYASNAAGQAAFSTLLKPVFDAAGVEVTGVEIQDPGSTSADVQAAMTNAGAADADVFIPLITLQACINTYDAMKAMAISPVVVTTALCLGTPMTDHLAEVGETGTVPDGWYYGGYGYSYFQPDVESGMLTYVTKVQEYGEPAPGASTIEYTGFAGPMFANLLTATKFINEIGADNVTPETMREKIYSFAGPMMIQAGPLSPEGTTVLGTQFPAVTGQFMGVQQYLDGEWVSRADGLLGNAIDVTAIGQ